MKAKLKLPLFNDINKDRFSYLIISIAFFFAWINLLFESEFHILNWVTFPSWIFVIGGLTFPIILLVGATQNKSSIAFGVTMVIFTLTILTNLSFLPYYIREYLREIPFCSCCPMCEIRTIIKMVLACVFAISLMHRSSFLTKYQWEKIQSLKLISLVLILYFLDRVLF